MVHIVYFDNIIERIDYNFLFEIYNLRSFITEQFRQNYRGKMFTFCQNYISEKFCIEKSEQSYGLRLRFNSDTKIPNEWYTDYSKFLLDANIDEYFNKMLTENNITELTKTECITVCLDMVEVNFLKQNFDYVSYCDCRYSSNNIESFLQEFDFCVRRNIIREIFKNILC